MTPVIAEPDGWTPSDTATDGAPATHELEIPEPGRWLISLEYDSRRPLHVTSASSASMTTVPANLDFRGESPTSRSAEVRVDGPTDAEVTVEPERPNLIGRLLRAPNEAHLRSLTATPLDLTPSGSRSADLRQVRRLVPARLDDRFRARARPGPVAVRCSFLNDR